MQNVNLAIQKEARKLFEQLEKTQYLYKPTYKPRGNILTKEDIQKLNIPDNVPVAKTSGSTGIPTIVPKTRESIIWHMATNQRELQWRKWNMKDKNFKIVSIIARNQTNEIINDNIYVRKLDTIRNIQLYLQSLQPHYLYTYPSIVEKLDLTRLHNLIDIKTCGEIGATSYSSEETGTIALQCPENPQLMHIMENIIVETDPVHGVLITDMTNPLINRYALTDIVELGDECICGRTLPTIKKIHGRVRNMLLLPNGDKQWPTVGEPQFRSSISKKILQHQVIQHELHKFEIKLKVTEKLDNNEEQKLLDLVVKSLNQTYLTNNMFTINYVKEFPSGKFESFKCLI
jgi:phenylacetate-coenzyme A ligase PaaK-like adenylate-forming protein